MADHFNRLTPAQAERLALLAEECGEVIQMVGKVLRHGYASHHPNDPISSNRMLLGDEVGHVLAVVEMMCEAGDIAKGAVGFAATQKRERVGRWLHHAEVPRVG